MTYKLIGFQESCAVVLNVDANSPEHALEIAQKTNPHINFQMPENYSTTVTSRGDCEMFGGVPHPDSDGDEFLRGDALADAYDKEVNRMVFSDDEVLNEIHNDVSQWHALPGDMLMFGDPNDYQKPPHIITMFTGVQDEQLDLFEQKHADYGRDNIMSGDAGDPVAKTEALLSIYVRMQDKLNRLKRLIDSSASVKGETVRDTLLDLANYATIGTVVYDGEWKDG